MTDKNTRRDFLKKSSILGLVTVLGAPIVFAKNLNGISILGIEEGDTFEIEGKHKDLIILNDLPINAETPPHLLNDDITPNHLMFIRNNGIPPIDIDVSKWVLTFSGESIEKEMSFSLEELKSQFKHYSYQLVLECGGNGRSEFNPPAKGNQWSLGAVSNAKWTGVRLKDVLDKVGVKADAVYIGYYGADVHLSKDPTKTVISRGVPMSKALEEETLIAWSVNDEDIPYQNGFPLRLVVGGWPASASGKWLKEIKVRNIIHDGPKMGGNAYRMPCKSVAPGEKVAKEDMCIIESMPVKSLITFPKSGGVLKNKNSLEVNGKAWAGDLSVEKMETSIDFGATWQKAQLNEASNRLAWHTWNSKITFPEKGYYEVWARATDSQGESQPMVVPGWNPKGYLNNATHRIAIKVE